MCGILFSTLANITQKRFECALEKMRHRGPDVPMCHITHGKVQMGHNRLRIVGINEQSNQPYFSHDKRYIIVYNGEVYNFRELAAQYAIPLETGCDTELILKLSIKIGFHQAVEQFNGMFAYVIFDTITNSFFAVRDRFGIKPLYWYQNGADVIFASELSAILSLLDKTEIDEIGLRQYRKLRAFFNGHTLYKQIQIFPAGHYFENGELKRYWELPQGEQEPPSDEELHNLIVSAIQYRQISDVPVGCYLSGGLDSTIVAAIAGELHTWTVGFPDKNEFHYSELASRAFGTEHHEIVVQQSDFFPVAKRMIEHRQEPLSVPNEVLLYLMTKEVKKENTVVLSGEGADELFFGYDRIFRWASNTAQFDIREFSQLYSYGTNDDLEIVESVVEPFYQYGSPLNILAAFFQIAHLHGLLRRLDNATMMCSVEARVPFTDHRLVERLAGCPYWWRMPNGQVKGPLKRVFQDIVPQPIICREKVGFPVPFVVYDDWFSFNMQTLGLETLHGKESNNLYAGL